MIRVLARKRLNISVLMRKRTISWGGTRHDLCRAFNFKQYRFMGFVDSDYEQDVPACRVVNTLPEPNNSTMKKEPSYLHSLDVFPSSLKRYYSRVKKRTCEIVFYANLFKGSG